MNVLKPEFVSSVEEITPGPSYNDSIYFTYGRTRELVHQFYSSTLQNGFIPAARRGESI